MIKRIDKIIQSKTAPENNNVLWYDGENLKINRNGNWENGNSIDPVIWKYLCNPCIIEYGKSVPEELIGKYNEDVGDSGGYMLKYPNMGMYKIKYEYEDSKYMIINSERIDTLGISCGDQYIPGFSAIEVFYIDSNKKWSMF